MGFRRTLQEMTNCIEIAVLNAPKAAINRMGGQGEIYLDIPRKDAIRLYKDVEVLSDVNQILSEAAVKFNLPFTRANDAASIEFYSPATLDRSTTWMNVRVKIDGHGVLLTRMYVTNKDEQQQQWEYELQRPEDHWMELAGTKKINTIDYGTKHIQDDTLVETWEIDVYEGKYDPADNDATVWHPADYGGWVDITEDLQNLEHNNINYKVMATEDLRPFISLPYILKRGFCEIGWTVGGVIFDSEWFRSLWVYCLAKAYYFGATSVAGGSVAGDNYTEQILNTALGIGPKFTDLSLGAGLPLPDGGGAYMCGCQTKLKVKSWYLFKFKATIENTSGSDSILNFAVGEVGRNGDPNYDFSGEILSDYVEVDIDAGETKLVSFEVRAYLNPGQKGAIFILDSVNIVIHVKPGLFFRADPDNQSYTTGDIITINKSVRGDVSLLDMLKGTLSIINGRVETDYVTRTVNIFPNLTSDVYGFTVPGFLLDSEIIDISDKVIPGSVQALPVRSKLKRFTLLEFKESSDAYISQQKPPQPAHSRIIENGVDLPNQTTKLTNPIFEPTLEGRDLRLKTPSGGRAPQPFLPRMWDNTEGKRSFDIGVRILFNFGRIRQIRPDPPSIASKYTGFFFNGTDPITYPTGNAMDTFGYLTQRRTWEVDTTPALDGNVVWGKMPNDLFVNFALGITLDGQNGTSLDVLMYVAMRDYIRYNFRQYFQFIYKGRPIRAIMTGIRDFAGCAGFSTPVTFFLSPSATQCCDRPCSCRFQNCEYYMDFGVLMRQGSLDNMRISKFRVDEVELLDAPVDFGTKNVIDIGGKPYVTNLVDALNSIGAPYFLFSYSNRLHPQKGLRFFKAKWPACQGFEIEITLYGEPVYRYTHDSQAQKWFGADYSPLGYGDEFYDEPIDCQVTIEY